MSNQSAMERTRATLRGLPARFRKATPEQKPPTSVASQVSSEFGQFLSEDNPEAAAGVLELILRHGQVRNSREQPWVKESVAVAEDAYEGCEVGHGIHRATDGTTITCGRKVFS